jgi:hypothetical protein
MIIENDHKTRSRHIGPYDCEGLLAEVVHPSDFADFLAKHSEIRDTTVHARLQRDLVEYL